MGCVAACDFLSGLVVLTGLFLAPPPPPAAAPFPAPEPAPVLSKKDFPFLARVLAGVPGKLLPFLLPAVVDDGLSVKGLLLFSIFLVVDFVSLFLTVAVSDGIRFGVASELIAYET